MSVYTRLKVFHHTKRLLEMKDTIPFPIHVQLVPTNRCNQNCQGCAYRLEGYSSNQRFQTRDTIPWPKLSEIVDDCQRMGVKAIQVTGGGEPTVHPEFLALCGKILDAGIDLGVVTNGVRWSSEHTSVLSRAKWVRFSIDAGSNSTYAAYRVTPSESYYRARRNLRDLTSSSEKCEDLKVGVGFVVNAHNYEEIATAARKAKEDGADNFRISALFQPQGSDYFQKFYTRAKHIGQLAENLATDSFQVINQFSDRIQDLEDESPDYDFCGYSKLVTYIGADQNVYTCCCNAYNDRGLLGTLLNKPFHDLWVADHVRDKLRNVDPKRCPRCMYNSTNRNINYFLEPKPLHVNFI